MMKTSHKKEGTGLKNKFLIAQQYNFGQIVLWSNILKI